MIHSPAIPTLLEAARKGRVPYALLKNVAVQAARTAPDLLDELAYFVASQYAADEMCFEEAGEYHRESDPPDTHPATIYTRPLIEAFLAKYDQTRTSE